jgi:hypothetical protein
MRRILGGLMLAALASGCGGDDNGTVEQVVRRATGAFCQRVEACNPTGFAQRYGNGLAGVDACVNLIVNMIPPSELGRKSACNDSMVQDCVSDTRLLSCESVADPKAPLPSSCLKC